MKIHHFFNFIFIYSHYFQIIFVYLNFILINFTSIDDAYFTLFIILYFFNYDK